MSETSLKTQEALRIEKLEETLLEHEMKITYLEGVIDSFVEVIKSKNSLQEFC